MSEETNNSGSNADLYKPVGEFKGIKYFASDEARLVLESRGLVPSRMGQMSPEILRKNIEASELDLMLNGDVGTIDLKAIRSTNLRTKFTPIDYSSIEGFVSGYVSSEAAEVLKKADVIRHNESGRYSLVKNAASVKDFMTQINGFGLECRPAHEVDTGRVAYIADKKTPLVSTRTTRVMRRE